MLVGLSKADKRNSFCGVLSKYMEVNESMWMYWMDYPNLCY